MVDTDKVIIHTDYCFHNDDQQGQQCHPLHNLLQANDLITLNYLVVGGCLQAYFYSACHQTGTPRGCSAHSPPTTWLRLPLGACTFHSDRMVKLTAVIVVSV